MTGGEPVTLLTGATGFLGSALAARLLEQGRTVRCVVRGATANERMRRLRAALRVTEVRGASREEGISPAEWERVEVVPGDLAQERFGLPHERFEALGDGVTDIVHCGARVNMVLPYGALHGANVRATEELLGLAEARGARFAHVSSMAAVAHRLTGEPFELLDPVSGGYGQSKWSADRLVSVAHQEKRVRTVILRPGRVTADSRTGRSNPDDLMEGVVRMCATLGAAPRLDASVRLSPVDWVARLMIRLAGDDASFGRAYHVVSDRSTPWSSVPAALRAAGYAVDELPYDDWRSLAVAAGRDDVDLARLAHALPAGGLVFDDRAASRPARARRDLAEGFPEPPEPEALLRSTLAAWRRTGRLPAPHGSPADAPRPGHGGDR
ncbi:thioester reductase domain-containing protein [Streptomyces sp. NBC_00250]|uniref:thioester reductase domain-containing protein n=1 Tax=Streptomyces sp. NBC_00250 TaxID=2903641 RepID=UPI002E2A94B4|nr:thioester reductase domain-containing protein [Streptomyces sp. NBC_00250]